MKIFKIVFILFVLGCFASCNNTSKNSDNDEQKVSLEYIIKGKLANHNGELIVLEDADGQLLASDTIRNNQFCLQKDVTTDFGFLFIYKNVKTPIFLTNSSYKVREWDNNPERLFVESTNASQEEYADYLRKLANLDRRMTLLSTKEWKILQKEYIANVENFITQNKDHSIGLFELEQHLDVLQKNKTELLYATLSEESKNTEVGKMILAKLLQNTVDKETANIATPQPKKPERFPAPLFSGLTPEGYMIDLQNIISQNKIIMLDFWATWCQPCRMQTPFWTRLYRKYHDKGFEIVGIAEERPETRANLEAVIAKDNMTWKHFVDTNNEIAELYGAYSLPHAVLIDGEGKLIYHKASARDIQEFLDDFFAQ